MIVQEKGPAARLFDALNAVGLLVLGLSCLLPIVHIAAVSFSSAGAVGGGRVSLWPIEPTLQSYNRLMQESAFFRAAFVSVLRTVVGTVVNVGLAILVAYPMAQADHRLRLRRPIMVAVVITMYFHAGLIPTYMVVRAVGLLDSFWALILPTAVPVWSVIILMNFFRTQPDALEEAARIDGATPLQTLIHVAVPIARPAIATISLFALLKHWNSWFDGFIYLNRPHRYPLQTYLYGQIVNSSAGEMIENQLDDFITFYSEETLRAAQILLATVPIIVVYPLLQKHFVKGIVLGSVKG